jgi:RNA polymerase sigma-70 factor, ECF subfamily
VALVGGYTAVISDWMHAEQQKRLYSFALGEGWMAKAGRTRAATKLPDSSNADLAALIASVGNRDAGAEQAIRDLHDQTVGALMALARGMLRNKADAEEIVCDTYVQVWQSAQKFDASRGSAMAWLAMMCRSRALDRIRERNVRTKLLANASAEPVDTTDDGPERLMSMLQTDSRVHGALAKLSTDKRRLVELAFLEGLSHADLSARTGVPLGTVKSTLRRSLQTLHASLEGAA